jgi:hypothetical protein
MNFGRTRADELLALKVEQACEAALAFLLLAIALVSTSAIAPHASLLL